MLVLSRQRDESIMIGDNIVVTIVDIRGDKVRLGINAPKDVAVHREEIFERIKAERSDGDPAGHDDAGHGHGSGNGHGHAANGNGSSANGNGAANGNGHYNVHS